MAKIAILPRLQQFALASVKEPRLRLAALFGVLPTSTRLFRQFLPILPIVEEVPGALGCLGTSEQVVALYASAASGGIKPGFLKGLAHKCAWPEQSGVPSVANSL